MLLIIFVGDDWFNLTEISEKEYEEKGRKITLLTMTFNTFVWFQIFNEVNARRVNNEKNVVEGIFKNSIFWGVICVTVAAQILLVEFGGSFVLVEPLTWDQWLICVGFGAGEMIWHQLVILVPVDFQDGIQQMDADALFKRDLPDLKDVQVHTQ